MSLYIFPPLQTVAAPAPIVFQIDGISTNVNIDTGTPANSVALPVGQWFQDENGAVQVYKDSVNENNSKPLPAGLYYIKDGVIEPVNRDTVTPANTRAIPVEIVDITGVPVTLNLTTGDLGVEISHDGLAHTWDSTRIGDGTNLLVVNASGEATVHDADVLARLILMDAKLPATLGSKADVGSFAVTQSTEDKAALAAMSAKLPATLGSKADAVSLAVTQSIEDKVIQAAIQTAVEAIQSVAEANSDIVENYYKRNFTGSPLTVVASWVTLRTLTASIKKIIITQNGGNELLIRNATSGKEIIVGQGVGMEVSLLGVATDVIEISALGADALDGIIYINFEG